VPSRGGVASESQSSEVFGGGVTEDSDLGELVMILLQGTCRDRDRGQILTTTDAPPLPYLSESIEEKCGSEIY